MNFSLTHRLVPPVPASSSRHALGARLAKMACGAALLTAASRLTLPFVGTPVPFTLQPQAVLLVAALWPRPLGVGAVCSWLALGFAGLPVFAAGVTGMALVGPTAGYLLSYPSVAYAVARWGRGTDVRSALTWLLASMAILLGGVMGLVPFVGLAMAWQAGFLPFVAGDASKATLLFLLSRQLRKS